MKELVITNKGKELIAKLIEGSDSIKFTRIKTSTYIYDHDDIEDLLDIENIKQESLISSVEKIDNSAVEVLAMINNAGLEEGYYIQTLGLYVEDSNENEILYGVSISSEYPDYMPAYSGKTMSSISYRLITKVDNTEQVNIEINPSATPTITQFNEIKNITIETKNLFDEHSLQNVLNENGVHGLKYDKSTQTLKYKDNDNWEDVLVAQVGNDELNLHKEKNISDVDGVHGFKFDEDTQTIKYKKDNDWIKIPTGEKVKEELIKHSSKKISETGGIHGLEYLEEDDSLQITKQSGEKIKFASGVPINEIFNEYIMEMDNIISKVGK